MPLQEQDLVINFAGTVDTKTDPWQVSLKNFLALNNSVFTVGGRLTKRNGFGALGKTINTPFPPITFQQFGGALTNARKIFSYQNELLINDAWNLFSYDQSNNGWTYKGRSTAVSLNTADIAQDANTKSDMDCSIDTTSGVKIFAWQETGGTAVKYSIQDINTGQFIVNKQLFGNGANYQTPRCLSISGQSYVLAVNTIDGKLYYQSIVGQTITGSATALVTNLNASHPYYDIDVSAGNIYLTYFTTTPSINISLLTSSLATTSSITNTESATNGLSFFGDGTNIWVVYNNGSATKAFIVNNAVTVTVLAPTIVDSGTAASNVSNVTGVWSSTQNTSFIFYDNSNLYIEYNTLTLAGSAGTPKQFMRSVTIVSKAFVISGIPHLVAIYDQISNLQNTYFLLNLYNTNGTMGVTLGTPVANIAAKICSGLSGTPSSPGWLCGVHNPSGSTWELALGQKTAIGQNVQASAQIGVTPSTIFFSSVGVIDCKFNFALSNPDVQVLANNAHIASGQLTMYDAANVVEQNFHIFPEGLAAVVSNTGGSLGSSTSNTLYGIIVTYEWFDNQGNLHRSYPSNNLSPLAPAQTYTFAMGTTTGKLTVTVPTLRVTNKSGVTIKVYRTIGNGTVYYLENTAFGDTANDPTVDSVTIPITTSDVAVVSNIQLYTNGELPDEAPPSPAALSTFKNRILLVPAEGGFDFLYSKQVLSNFPVEFVGEFDQNIGTVAGHLVAIAGMDDKIILFKSGIFVGPSILYMVGTGPSASGANNDFQDPLPVAVDCGCVDRASIVLTPSGLIFKSDKGIYLLDRGLQASYIGAAVEGYNQYSVLSAQLIPDTTQVRFILSNGIMLMFDYFYNRWGTFTPPAGISDCIFQGQHTYVASNGQPYQETPSVYVDGTATPVLVSFQTANINLAGISGYERIREFLFLANYLSPHQLQVEVGYNYQTENSSVTITPNTNFSPYQWRIHMKRQICQSFQLTVNEVYTGTLGASFTMTGITCKIITKKGIRPIAGANAAGLS